MEHVLTIWEFVALVFILVVISKILSKMTKSVDVLWLILFGAIIGNMRLVYEHSHGVEFIGELGIIFTIFLLNISIPLLIKFWSCHCKKILITN